MFKIQKELNALQQVLAELDGEFGQIEFNPFDPSSIENAIQKVNQLIDARTADYSSSPIASSLIDNIKDSFRENILGKAAETRLMDATTETANRELDK